MIPLDFVQKSPAPIRVKVVAWLVAHKKLNTNKMLEIRKLYKALNTYICLLEMDNNETVYHLFLHCFWYGELGTII